MKQDLYSRNLTSKRCKALKGDARIPGDKSISHRSIMLGALAVGETIVSGLLEGEDVLHTAMAMRAMGAKITHGDDGLWRIYGVGVGGLREPDQVLEMGNSGTSTRLLMGLVGGHNITATFTGDASLVKRPMKRIVTPLEMMGATFLSRSGDRLPLTVKGAENALPIEYRLPVASAQVKSAIMLAGLNAAGRTTVIEDHPTRDHTENMLRHFGVEVEVEKLEGDAHAIHLLGHQELQGCAVDVPSDPSSAAFAVVAALINEGSEISLSRVGVNETRIGLYTTLQEMGADIEFKHKRIEAGEPVADIIVKGTGSLRGIDVPESRVPSMIDEFPILAVAAACAQGTTKMTGLKELRVKESDRLLMVANGLKVCGVNFEMGEESLIIHGTGKSPEGGACVETALDHRIAMSFLILGTVTQEPVSIDDAAPIKTSFPNFIELMNDLGTEIGTPDDSDELRLA
ncbi:MAG: 3-phosphoshikimate 1-carboxyvinyltransferase [Alphaproteobacteria bacterium]|nr:MAG: 3-phosphoshikimate 1-carboxyvinyltransferase [Alphaproteobacteria bacterium]